MEQQPESPPARAARPHLAPGDLLAPLRRSWLDLAGQILPRDASLVELLNDRLRVLSVKSTVPTEAELLTVAEEAAHYAVGSASSEDARELSKRLRRAIYEYLLSLDVVLAVAAPTPELPPVAHGSDEAVTAAAWRSRRDGRPELVWDEPALRVLDGGAEGVAEAATAAPAQPSAAPSGVEVAAPPPYEAESAFSTPSDAEAPEDVQADDAVEAEPDGAGSDGDAEAAAWMSEPAPAEPADNADAEPAAAEEPPPLLGVDPTAEEGPGPQTTTRIGAEALRVPEQFRRDLVVPSRSPSPLVVLAAAGSPDGPDPDPPVVPTAVESTREPEPPVVPPAAEAPRAPEPAPLVVLPEAEVPRPQEPAALVVPSYRAWADVLASGATEEPETTRPTAAPPIPFARPRPLRGLAARVSAGRAAQTPAPGHDRSEAPRRDAGVSRTEDDAPGAPEWAAGQAVLDDAPVATTRPAVGDLGTEAPAEDAEPRWAFAAPGTSPRTAEPPGIADQGVGEGADDPQAIADPGSLSPDPDELEDRWSEPAAWLRPVVDSAEDEPDGVIVDAGHWPASSPSHGWEGLQSWPTVPSAPANRTPRPAPEVREGEEEPRAARDTTQPRPGQATDETDAAWSVRRSPRQQALQQRMALRRREEVILAAAAFDESVSARPRRDRLADLVVARLPEQIEELLRRKRTGEAAALVQRAAQEVGGRKIADLALECGDQCRARHQARAAINSYLAAWRADPVYEAPLWRLAETCMADKEVELAVGYLERIADLMRARGDDQGAIGVYRKVISVSPERGDVRALLQTAQTLGRFPD